MKYLIPAASRCSASYLAVLFAGLALPTAPLAGQVGGGAVDPGFRAWQAAAQAGRADVLILGDSVTLFGGHGWDAGFHQALATRYGLAGTGLMYRRSSGQGETYGSGNTFSAPFVDQNGHVPADDDFAPLGSLNAAATPAALAVGFSNPSLVDLSAGGTLDVWARDDGNGQVTYDRRLGQPPWTVNQPDRPVTLPTVAQAAPTALTIDPTNDPASEIRLKNLTETDLFAWRVQTPNPGVTITSVGLGGRSTRDHFTEFYQPLSNPARVQLYDMVTHGSDSGKLAVFLLQGFNDRNETSPSLGQGLADADSPEAFADNTRFYLDQLMAVWDNAGRNPDDLSFVVAEMYPIAGDETQGELPAYGDALRQLAAADDRVSFIDPWAGLTVAEVAPLLQDGLHPNPSGSLSLSETLWQHLDSAASVALAGDYNASGSVEQGDLDLVLNQWGAPRGTWSNANGFATINVDQEELDAVLNHWGSVATPDLRGLSVPEPGVGLVLAGATALLRRRCVSSGR